MATPHGPAGAWLDPPTDGRPPRATVMLLHGAGSGSDVPVLVDLAAGLAAAGFLAVRLEQAHRVAGRRAPPPVVQLDAVVLAAVAGLRSPGLPLLLVGRSTGARVACRVAPSAGAVAVCALGYPLTTPRGASRAAELAGAGVPVLVVEGSRDGFGTPDELDALGLPGVTVHGISGADHAYDTRRRDGRPPGDALREVVQVATRWLVQVLDGPGRQPW